MSAFGLGSCFDLPGLGCSLFISLALLCPNGLLVVGKREARILRTAFHCADMFELGFSPPVHLFQGLLYDDFGYSQLGLKAGPLKPNLVRRGIEYPFKDGDH